MVERPAVILREAVPVFPDFVPVTVWAPADEAVQTFALQDPFGAIENTVLAVTSPTELPKASKPSAA